VEVVSRYVNCFNKYFSTYLISLKSNVKRKVQFGGIRLRGTEDDWKCRVGVIQSDQVNINLSFARRFFFHSWKSCQSKIFAQYLSRISRHLSAQKELWPQCL